MWVAAVLELLRSQRVSRPAQDALAGGAGVVSTIISEPDEGELLPARPRDLDTFLTLQAQEELSQLDEHLVAGQVTVVHVKSLEVINVDQRNPRFATVSHRFR